LGWHSPIALALGSDEVCFCLCCSLFYSESISCGQQVWIWKEMGISRKGR